MRQIIWLLLPIVVFSLAIASCTKTIEKVFSATEECEMLKKYDLVEEYRDEYDNCILFTREELEDTGECKKRCQAYCEKNSLDYRNEQIDFSGCHCYCTATLKSSKELSSIN